MIVVAVSVPITTTLYSNMNARLFTVQVIHINSPLRLYSCYAYIHMYSVSVHSVFGTYTYPHECSIHLLTCDRTSTYVADGRMYNCTYIPSTYAQIIFNIFAEIHKCTEQRNKNKQHNENFPTNE